MIENINNRIIDANVKLQDENKLLKEDKEILKRRIDKAIEYVEENTNENEAKFYGIPDYKVFKGNIEQVLKILKGEYIKEEK